MKESLDGFLLGAVTVLALVCLWQYVRTILKRRQVPGQRTFISCDPGPDPDDAKVVLMAAALHKKGVLQVEGIITNGGQQAKNRAKLALALLKSVHMQAQIPVGIGSDGKLKKPGPYEYRIDGFDEIQDEELTSGHLLLMRTLEHVPPKSLVVQIQSAATDIALAIQAVPTLFAEKVKLVSVMGGLEFKGNTETIDEIDAATGDITSKEQTASPVWVADAAQNNTFDMDSANLVYSFCIDKGIPLTVISRHAVPDIPMDVAREYSDMGQCALDYLATMQDMGLVTLWSNVTKRGPDRTLPARCNEEWFWTTFCGVSKEGFAAMGDEALNCTDIQPRLQGTVKPYDVVSFLTTLPGSEKWFDFPKARHTINGVNHHFLLTADHMPELSMVIRHLQETFSSCVDMAARRSGTCAHYMMTKSVATSVPAPSTATPGGSGPSSNNTVQPM